MKSLASSAAAVAALLSFATFAETQASATATAPNASASVSAPSSTATSAAGTAGTATDAVSVASKLPIPNNPFHLRAGFSVPFMPGNATAGTPNGYGIGAVVEPGFAPTDWFLVGLRIDAGVIAAIGVSGSGASVGLTVPVATQLKLELGLPGTVRPFLGVGVGPYFLVNLSASGGSGGAGAGFLQGTYWGASPQVGMDFGGFRLAALYHFLPTLQSANFFALELSWRT